MGQVMGGSNKKKLRYLIKNKCALGDSVTCWGEQNENSGGWNRGTNQDEWSKLSIEQKISNNEKIHYGTTLLAGRSGTELVMVETN